MRIESLSLKGLLLIEPTRYRDKRGSFSETYSRRDMQQLGFFSGFVQDNHSYSCNRGVVRGLHFQAPPHAQDKLVRVTRGSILDVAVDIRNGSPTYGEHVEIELSSKNWRQLLIPKGFAHGFCSLEPNSEVIYKTTDYYAPDCEGAIRWDDADLDIGWPVHSRSAIVSDKDANSPTFKEFLSPFSMEKEERLLDEVTL